MVKVRSAEVHRSFWRVLRGLPAWVVIRYSHGRPLMISWHDDPREAWEHANAWDPPVQVCGAPRSGSVSYQHGPIPPGPLTAEELAHTEDD